MHPLSGMLRIGTTHEVWMRWSINYYLIIALPPFAHLALSVSLEWSVTKYWNFKESQRLLILSGSYNWNFHNNKRDTIQFVIICNRFAIQQNKNRLPRQFTAKEKIVLWSALFHSFYQFCEIGTVPNFSLYKVNGKLKSQKSA